MRLLNSPTFGGLAGGSLERSRPKDHESRAQKRGGATFSARNQSTELIPARIVTRAGLGCSVYDWRA
jgi:hypothetical protein